MSTILSKITELLYKIIELDQSTSRYEHIYNTITKTMGELQPIAFLMSATLALAGIFSKEGNLQSYIFPALIASYCFLFTYFNLFTYKLTKYDPFIILGIFSGVIGFFYILGATGGFYNIIPRFPTDLNITNFTVAISQYGQFRSSRTLASDISKQVVYSGIPALSMLAVMKYLDKDENKYLFSLVYSALTVFLFSYGIIFFILYIVVSVILRQVTIDPNFIFIWYAAMIIILLIIGGLSYLLFRNLEIKRKE